MQLADAALSRDLFPGDYHCLGDNENRPIKWMPVEAIQKSYSKASDIWSFGVFLWELMTKAQQPFSDVDPFEMESYLNEGYRLHQPMNCPDQLYSVLAACWGTRPHERASLQSLHTTLQSLQYFNRYNTSTGTELKSLQHFNRYNTSTSPVITTDDQTSLQMVRYHYALSFIFIYDQLL